MSKASYKKNTRFYLKKLQQNEVIVYALLLGFISINKSTHGDQGMNAKYRDNLTPTVYSDTVSYLPVELSVLHKAC